jgi:zinc transporter 1/2/3
VISDTGGEGCIQHGTHWHCPAGLSAPCNAVLQDYDLPLHIAALFVLLVASSIGVCELSDCRRVSQEANLCFVHAVLPVVLGAKARMSSSIANVFFVFRHFGSGVIISTGMSLHHFILIYDN